MASTVWPFFTSTCTAPVRACWQIPPLCPTCGSGGYTVLGSDNNAYVVYCLLNPAAPLGSGWMLLSQGGGSCAGTMASRATLMSGSTVLCGYLPDAQVRLHANQAANVKLAVTTTGTPNLGRIATWSNIVYTESQPAIVALRTGTSWNLPGAYVSANSGLPITWQGDSTWVFSATCTPVSYCTWPNMYHAVRNALGFFHVTEYV